MAITPPYYPIVYVRGYAATMGAIEETVATPYMGFNLGATKIRQDYAGEIIRFIFESPLVRLIKDEGYLDTYRDGDLIPPGEAVPARSVWIFRYYEPVSEDLGAGQRRSIVRFAVELRRFILRIRDQVCGKRRADRQKFRVYLVAHSMGGLICRTYLQNVCHHGTRDAVDSATEARTLDRKLGLPGLPLVDKVFTYATPHNGIELGGMNVPDLGPLDRVHVQNFNRSYMREYLRLPKSATRVDSLHGRFPVERFFCLVGTNHRDYGLAAKATGPMSDGLVMMRNATVDKAPRAFVHRSHSGDYGVVNSEEGYQNLRRFLFGDVRVDVTLAADEITLPAPVAAKVGAKRDRVKAAYNIEVTAKVRGATSFLNERKVSQESAIRRTYERLVKEGKPVYLFSGYLAKPPRRRGARTGDATMAFAVRVAIQVPLYEIDRRFWFNGHFEGGYLLDETVTFEVRMIRGKARVTAGRATLLGPGSAADELTGTPLADERLRFEVPLGFATDTASKPQPGFRGRLLLTASRWNDWA